MEKNSVHVGVCKLLSIFFRIFARHLLKVSHTVLYHNRFGQGSVCTLCNLLQQVPLFVEIHVIQIKVL